VYFFPRGLEVFEVVCQQLLLLPRDFVGALAQHSQAIALRALEKPIAQGFYFLAKFVHLQSCLLLFSGSARICNINTGSLFLSFGIYGNSL
jgi:hypothetical protein